MLDVGKRSMMNSQTALQTVSHNIANKNTEGFSRQRVETQTNVPISSGKYQIGMGARTATINRINNPYLEKQIGKEQSQMGFLNGQSQGLMRVEQIYNEQGQKGLNVFVSDFFNSFRELANNPESVATRTMVKETASLVAKDFKRMNNQLDEVRKDIDEQIKTHVDEINGITAEIGQLNEKIQAAEVGGKGGAPANDERDRRDLLIKQLGEKVNIKWTEGDDTSVTISAGNNAILVAGFDAKKLSVSATPGTDAKGEASYDIYYHNTKEATPMNVTRQFNGGQIGGLLAVRDQTITQAKNDMDEMAYTLARHVNDMHVQGFDGYNRTGQVFFEPLFTSKNAAENFKLAAEIEEDPARIAAAAAPDSPADNRLANIIANLQYEKIVPRNNGTTVDDFYNGMVGEIGVVTKRANTAKESQDGIVKQLTHLRESISGVSLDEETTKMIEFQKAFDASARLIRTADEMFDTVLNLKRY